MGLNIGSTDADLKSLIDKIEKVNLSGGEDVSVVTISEFQDIRDKADLEIAKVTYPSVVEGLATTQKLADELVEALQRLALAARKSKLKVSTSKFSSTTADPATEAENLAKKTQLTALKRAIEFQLTYADMGYKYSVEML
jgi:predicted transcriptional regulator